MTLGVSKATLLTPRQGAARLRRRRRPGPPSPGPISSTCWRGSPGRWSAACRRGGGREPARGLRELLGEEIPDVVAVLEFGCARGRAAAGPHHRRDHRRAARPRRRLRAGRAVRLADARAGQRAADRAATSTRSTRRRSRRAVGVGGRVRAGRLAAGAPPRRHRRRTRAVSGSPCGARAAMRTQGDDLAEILALIGCRPVWDEASRRVTGFEIVPARRARPPAHRRHRAHLRVLPRRVPARHRAARRRDPRRRRARRARRAELPARPRRGGRRRSTATGGGPRRGSSVPSPGRTGPGLLPLIDARNWRSDADLAEVYAVWGGYAYGRGLDGREARADMESVVPPDRGGGEEPGHPRARHRRLRRLLPVPRRHGRHRARADRALARRVRRRLRGHRRRARPARWPRRPSASSAPGW